MFWQFLVFLMIFASTSGGYAIASDIKPVPRPTIEKKQDTSLERQGFFDSLPFLSTLDFGGKDNEETEIENTILDTDNRISIEELIKEENIHIIEKPKEFPKPLRRPAPLTTGELSSETANLYEEIFKLQALGKWKDADNKIDRLRDRRLMGHVLYQRYMHDNYISSFDELKEWMDRYADYAFSIKIYRIANRKAGKNKRYVKQPIKARMLSGSLGLVSSKGGIYKSKIRRNAQQDIAIRDLLKKIKHNLSKERPTAAYKILKTSEARKYLDDVEFDMYRSQIAAGYMYVGENKKAIDVAIEAIDRSGNSVPLAGWVAGMISWKDGYYEDAAKYFQITATSPYASGWTSSAGAYWTSRSYMRQRKLIKVSFWLKKAAEYPRTFYGLIAVRALGQDFDFSWEIPKYTEKHKNHLLKFPAARRAMMLMQAKQFNFAERELRMIHPRKDNDLRQALIAYANEIGLSSYSVRFGSALYNGVGRLYDGALYPDLRNVTKKDYVVDRALVHAIIRQESKFNPTAESYSGALGLMQIMPSTANYIKKTKKYSHKDGKHQLLQQDENIHVGQKYIKHLMSLNNVGNDLMFMSIAYNAGPGNLRKWKRQFKNIDDSLLFIESIPIAETRAYVERVMANFWVYRIKYDQQTPSLDDAAAGRYTKYTSMDETSLTNFAKN